MIKKIVFFLFFLACSTKITNNSFVFGDIWLDTNGEPINAHGGGFLIYKNTYYWFGEHKNIGKNASRAKIGVRVYSSKDLYNWKNEGVALSVVNDTLSKLQKGCIIERPKVIFNKKTKKFVMWFHHELKDKGYKSALTGVAISENVLGPYKYKNSFRIHAGILPKNLSQKQYDTIALIDEKQKLTKQVRINQAKRGEIFKRDFEDGQMSRDMTLFVDDDETAYHITASEENQTLLVSKLTDDYASLSKEYIRVFPGERNEAPAIFKRKGKYYLFSSGLTGWKPNPAKLAVTDSIFGNWKFLGNPCKGNEIDKKTTFRSQSTYVIPVLGKKDAYIFAADRWDSKELYNSRYVWLPIQFKNDIPFLEWKSSWDLRFFLNKKGSIQKTL